MTVSANQSPSPGSLANTGAPVVQELAGEVGVLRGDAHLATGGAQLNGHFGKVGDGRDVHPAFGDGDDQHAASKAELAVDHEDVVVLGAVLGDDVVAGDAEL